VTIDGIIINEEKQKHNIAYPRIVSDVVDRREGMEHTLTGACIAHESAPAPT
jgi:hypothetical protein